MSEPLGLDLTEADARAQLDAIKGISWRPFERDDLPAVLQCLTDAENFDRNPERSSLDSLQEFWDSPRSVPEEDTLAGWDADGRVVAVAWSGCNRTITQKRGVYVGGAVHPSRRGQGIGRAVLAWELAHGREWDAATREPGFGPLTMRLYAPTDQADVRDLAERFGLAVERYFFEMERPLETAIPDIATQGVRLTDWDDARSLEVLDVLNVSFRDHWGHTDRTEQMWREQITGASFRPDWSVLALDSETGEVVGVALGAAYEQDWSEDHREGYTEQLGVLREYRGRGIASALLAEQMRRFLADGMDVASLGVDADNTTGALRLYESLGYRQTSRTCAHQRLEVPVS